jgi:predicted metalloendopeptidase
LDSLRQILEGSYDELLNASRTAGNANDKFITPLEIEKDRNNFNKIKSYYQSCMDENSIDGLGPSPIYQEISKLLVKLGVLADGRFTIDNMHEFTEALIHLGMEGVDNLISYSVNADDKNPEENSISLNQPSLGLPSREYYYQPEMLTHYRAGLISIVKAVLGEANSGTPIDNVRRTKMGEHQVNMLSESQIEAMVDRFIDFESRLAKITLPK